MESILSTLQMSGISWQGKNFLFAMNGQTGKLVGDLPSSRSKALGIFAAIAAPLKKKISPHKLRSTFGTNLYRETGDIYLVADVLGHSDVNTTRKHYAAIAEDHRRIAAQKTVLREEPVHPKSPE